MSARFLIAAVASLCVAIGDASADSLRCPGGLVQTGDTKLDLLGKCGEPALVEPGPAEERAARRMVVPDGTIEERVRWFVDRWTYDLGPASYLQHVELAGGRVTAIARGQRHGTATEPKPAALARARCEPSAIHVDDRAAEVLLACGEPAVRDSGRRTRSERIQVSADEAQRHSVSVSLDVWIFDFGPQRFSAIVMLEDGLVRKVERGGYGYSQEQ